MGNEIDILEYQAVWKNQNHRAIPSPTPVGSGTRSTTTRRRQRRVRPRQRRRQHRAPTLTLANPDTQFHIYGAHWFPGGIVWYIDGKAVYYQAHRPPATSPSPPVPPPQLRHHPAKLAPTATTPASPPSTPPAGQHDHRLRPRLVRRTVAHGILRGPACHAGSRRGDGANIV